jgi:hypothetical protein
MSKLLKAANKHALVRNVFTDDDMDLPMGKFLMKSYTTCTPNKYGDLFAKKVIHDSKNILKELSATLDRGDCHVDYDKFFECKISFRNISGKYSITNIRNWQNFDYFILCFVDVQNDFKPQFFCIPKETITNNPAITLTGMNNTTEINSKNLYVGTRTTISDVDINWLFKNNNVLEGTSYKHVQKFINQSRKK